MAEKHSLSLFDQDVLIENADDLLAHYERIIDRGIETAIEVTSALLAIRDGKLYKRKGYKTFEQYCDQDRRMTRQRAYQLIDAGQVIDNLSTRVDILPASEKQARPLASFEPEEQVEIWQAVIETAPEGKITTAHVKATVAKIKGKPAGKLDVHYSSDTPEHYTPLDVLKAVVLCLGTIDLDPCSNSHSAPHVPANKHYTQNEDGLLLPWHGRVFMNPPYGDEIAKWVDKLCSEETLGNVTEAIALVPARTDTDWFSQLIDDFKPVCYVHGRLKFVDSEGKTQGSAPFPSAIVYHGTEFGRFYYNFAGFGRICQEAYPGVTFAD